MVPKACLFKAALLAVCTTAFHADRSETKQRSFITPPDYFDRIRNSQDEAASVIQLSTSMYQVTTNVTGVGDASYRLVDIGTFLPFSEGEDFREPVQNDAASLLLAIYHFNNILQSPFDIRDCDIRFTTTFYDTEVSPVVTTKRFTQVLRRQHYSFELPAPGAVVGAYRSAETAPLAIWTGVNGIPQMSYASTSADFDVKAQFPLLGRTVTNSDGEAAAAVQLFESLGSSHVGVLFVMDAYGSALQKSFQDLAAKHGIQTTAIAFSSQSNDLQIAAAMASLQTTQFRHVYAILYESHYEPVMAAALMHNIVGNQYLWIFPGFDLMNIYDRLAFPLQSPLVKATSGIGIITITGGVTATKMTPGVEFAPPLETNTGSGFEIFRAAWRDAINDPYISSAFRSKILEDIGRRVIPAFDGEPSFFSPFIYDAVMAIGASMCRAGSLQTNFSGVQVFDELRLLDFNGASGRVKFDNVTGTRDYRTMTFQLWNPVVFGKLDESDLVRFEMVPTKVFQDGTWQGLPDQPFFFSDGTTTPPPSLPPVHMDENFIGQVGRTIGYGLMGIIMLCSIVSLIWVIVFRKERVVRASQPFFLVMISTGTFVMASSILPLTFDRSFSSNERCLDSACMASPLLYLGGSIVAFSALYAKTRGVYQAYKDPDLNFIQVTSWDMAGGALIILVVNCLVVIPWALVAPLEWHTKLGSTTDVFGRPVESYGFCSSRRALPFGIVTLVLNQGVLIFFNAKAFLSRNIETEYLESRYIGISLASVLQAWLMGIPILVVVWTNPKARYFVETGIVFVSTLSTLLLMYVPKMFAVKADRLLELEQQKKQAYRRFSQRIKIPDDDDEQQRQDDNMLVPATRKSKSSLRKSFTKDMSVTVVMTELPEDIISNDVPEPEQEEEDDDELSGRKECENNDVISRLDVPPPDAFDQVVGRSIRDFSSKEEEESKLEESADDIERILQNRRWKPDSPREQFIPQQRLLSQMGRSMMFSKGAHKAKEATRRELGGVRVVFNPRSERNLRVTGGRELSRAQLFDFMHRKEDEIGSQLAEGDDEEDDQ